MPLTTYWPSPQTGSPPPVPGDGASGGAQTGTYDTQSASGGARTGFFLTQSASGGATTLAPVGNAVAGGGSYGAFTSQALRGGGTFGVFDAQSVRGGGSVSGVLVNFTTNGCGNFGGGMAFGSFFKVAALPGSTTTLIDLYGGPSGSLRVALTAAGHVLTESTVGASSVVSEDMGAIGTGTWYWVTVGQGCGGFSGGFSRLMGQLSQVGGTVLSSFDTGNTGCSLSLGGSISCVLGWGVAQSTGYTAFPSGAGNELSKLVIKDGSALIAMPTVDASPSGLVALYLCRESAGSALTLADATSNHYDLTPGANGLTVVVDGPYA